MPNVLFTGRAAESHGVASVPAGRTLVLTDGVDNPVAVAAVVASAANPAAALAAFHPQVVPAGTGYPDQQLEGTFRDSAGPMAAAHFANARLPRTIDEVLRNVPVNTTVVILR